MFKSKEVDDRGKVLVPAPMDHLDPLREHRFYCPWKNPEAQSRGAPSPGAVAAWDTLLQTVRNESSLRGVYEGKPAASPSRPALDDGRLTATAPGAPSPAAPEQPSDAAAAPPSHEPDDAEAADKARDAKDKERWARLKKVKGLFDSKGARILRRSISRPGTGHSNRS